MANDAKNYDFSCSTDTSSHFHEIFPNIMGMMAAFRMVSDYLSNLIEEMSSLDVSIERDVFKHKLRCEEMSYGLGVLHDHMYLIGLYHKANEISKASVHEEYVVSEAGHIARDMGHAINAVRLFLLTSAVSVSKVTGNGVSLTHIRMRSLIIELSCALNIFINYFKKFDIDMSAAEEVFDSEMEDSDDAHQDSK